MATENRSRIYLVKDERTEAYSGRIGMAGAVHGGLVGIQVDQKDLLPAARSVRGEALLRRRHPEDFVRTVDATWQGVPVKANVLGSNLITGARLVRKEQIHNLAKTVFKKSPKPVRA